MFKRTAAKDFIKRNLNTHRPEGNLVAFAVTNIGPQGQHSQLERVPVPENRDENWVETLLDLAEELTKNHCEGVPGVQSFAIVAEFDERDDLLHIYRHVAQAPALDAAAGSEPANAQGLLAMLMRHLEARERGVWGVVQSTMMRQESTIEQQARIIDNLQQRAEQSITIHEELQSRKAERDAIVRVQERKDKIADELLGKAMALLPVAVYKLTGKNVLGANVADRIAAGEITDSFLESISEDQFNQLVGPQSSLKHEQKAMLGALFEEYLKRKRTKRTADKKKEGEEV